MTLPTLALSLKGAMQRRNRFLYFLLVGGLNTLFGYSIFAFSLWLGAHFTLAVAISTFLGVLFNFKTTGRLVFGSRDNSRLFRFIAVYLVIYAVNTMGVWILGRLGISAYLAGLLMLLPLAIFAFFLNSRFVFVDD